ncbi:MAG: hypothetical protein AAF899_03255 [Pseudomonadota bacterium]
MTLDWLAVVSGGILMTVVAVTVIGDDAIGVVTDLNDREAAHEAAVAAAAERAFARRERAAMAEPRRTYYPDAPEIGGVTGTGTSASVETGLIAAPRDAGGTGAFEPAIAEPDVVSSAVLTDGLRFDVAVTDAAPEVDGTRPGAEDDHDCVAALRDNPFLSESLVQTGGCDTVAGPVLQEPRRDRVAPGMALETVVVDRAPAQDFALPERLDDCDAVAADSPFMSDSLREVKDCDIGAVVH